MNNEDEHAYEGNEDEHEENIWHIYIMHLTESNVVTNT